MPYGALLVLAVMAVLVLAFLYMRERVNTQEAARTQYEQWRASDLERITSEQRSIAKREALTELEHWRNENETAIRQNAIDRSRSVIVGKVTEHLTPWIPVFPYNPKDARFIGSPIDMIVFDGCDEEKVRRIIFLEIKTNSAGLTSKQRQIRDAIKAGKVEWREVRIASERGSTIESPPKRPLLP